MGILKVFHPHQAQQFLKKIEDLNPRFVCVIGSTQIAKIPGISAAGSNPDLTDYTPAADVEYLNYGRCLSIPGIPVTPQGIPTPAIITKAALDLAGIPRLVLDSGAAIKPKLEYLESGAHPGRDFRYQKAVEDAESIIQRSKQLGEKLAEDLARSRGYLIVGESIPGGTTTALGVMLCLGIDARNRMSSSMALNPHQLKLKLVERGMARWGIRFGDLESDPISAIEYLGDPMQPGFIGLVMGAASRIPVMLGGGTQMGAILGCISKLDPNLVRNVCIGTTRWIIEDRSADLVGIISQIAQVPILAADLDFSGCRYHGLRAYEQGHVKEGVGAGAATISGICSGIQLEEIVSTIEDRYAQLLSQTSSPCTLKQFQF